MIVGLYNLNAPTVEGELGVANFVNYCNRQKTLYKAIAAFHCPGLCGIVEFEIGFSSEHSMIFILTYILCALAFYS
jgi:hypothetical protein